MRQAALSARFTSLMSTVSSLRSAALPCASASPVARCTAEAPAWVPISSTPRRPEQAHQVVEGPTVAGVHPGLGREAQGLDSRGDRPPIALHAR